MTPELWKTVKDRWIEIIASILTAVGFVLDHWDLAGPRVSAIWEHVWPVMAAYVAFRIFKLGRSYYQRFTRLEAQALQDRSDLNKRLEAQAKSHLAESDAILRSQQQEIENRQVLLQLALKLEMRLKHIEEELHQEIKEREKVGNQLQELKAWVSFPTNRKSTLAELMFSGGAIQRVAEKKPPETRSLADIRPSGLFALGASPPKPKT